MYFMRRTTQLFKTKSRNVHKVQFNITKQISMKRNVRYMNTLNLEKFMDRYKSDKEYRKDESLKESKKDFFIDFNSELDWEESVMKCPIPVVVKFYAEYISFKRRWMDPCRQLLSFFYFKMEEQKNFKLVKLDIEKHREMVEKMGIDIVPTIFLIFKGIIVDSIIGFPDEERLNEFFTTITTLLETENDEIKIKSLLKQANEYIQLKEWDLSEENLNLAYNNEKLREKYGPIIKFGLGKRNSNKKHIIFTKEKTTIKRRRH